MSKQVDAIIPRDPKISFGFRLRRRGIERFTTPLQAFAAPSLSVFLPGEIKQAVVECVSRNLALKGTTEGTGQGPGPDIIS